MTPEEMVAAIKTLQIGARDERERDALLEALSVSVPHAMISDLIYYPDKQRSPEEIVAEALRREGEWQARNSAQNT